MIITISGAAGSGKSTIARILSKKLKFKRYYIGGMRRKIAKDKGMTLEEYNKLGEKDFSTDNDVDKFQKELGKKEDNIIVEGRTSWHFIPNSFKIFIDVDPKIGADRIFKDLKKNNERNERIFDTVEKTRQDLIERQKSDKKRYKKYYGFDAYDKSNYDLIIDTSKISAKEGAEKIINKLEL